MNPPEWQARVRQFCTENNIGHDAAVIRILGTPGFVQVREMFLAGTADQLVASELLKVARQHGLI